MGSYPRGILAYGYDLGGPYNGWKLNEYKDYKLVLPWWDNTMGSFADAAMRKLLAEIVGFTERWETRPPGDVDFWKRERDAKEQLSLEITTYGSYDYPGYILASKTFKADDWGMAIVEPFLDHSAFQRIARACEVLEITPTQSEPKWILASFYG